MLILFIDVQYFTFSFRNISALNCDAFSKELFDCLIYIYLYKPLIWIYIFHGRCVYICIFLHLLSFVQCHQFHLETWEFQVILNYYFCILNFLSVSVYVVQLPCITIVRMDSTLTYLIIKKSNNVLYCDFLKYWFVL